jgi:hypothetical protein
MTTSEWSRLFYQRLLVNFPELIAADTPDEYGHYTCVMPRKELDLFVMGCDDCFAAVWFNESPVCDYSDATREDAIEAATWVATLI